MDKELEAKRAELDTIMGEFIVNKSSAYDQHTREAAYWTVRNCLDLVKYATKMEHLVIAESMFGRWKHYV